MDAVAMIRHLIRDERGSNAVELVFVIPALVLLTFGIVDFGHAVFDWNAVEKATQVGAREAVIRDPVALPIKDYFATDCNALTSADVGLLCADPAGGIRSQCDFGTVVCTASGCTHDGAAIASTKIDPATFNAIVAAMQGALPRLTRQNVTLTYKSSRLGFIGKPDGPIAEVTAAVSGVPFDFLGLDLFVYLRSIYGGNRTIPTLSTTLTAEDLDSNTCAEQGLAETTNPQGQLVCSGNAGANAATPICF